MQLSLFRDLIRGRSDGLRDQKGRRVEQIAVIDGKFAADRSFYSQTEPDRMRPQRAQILPENIVRRNFRRAENIADAPENIAAVVKRNDAKALAQGNPRFEID